MEKERKPGHLYIRRSRPENRLYLRNVQVKPVEHQQRQQKPGHLYIRRSRPEHHLYIRNVRRKPEWLIYAQPNQEAA